MRKLVLKVHDVGASVARGFRAHGVSFALISPLFRISQRTT